MTARDLAERLSALPEANITSVCLDDEWYPCDGLELTETDDGPCVILFTEAHHGD